MQLNSLKLEAPDHNRLLAALPQDSYDRIFSSLEQTTMQVGTVLYESGSQMQYVYFPTTAIVSLHYIMENGSSAEFAGVGNEGVLGTSLFMGINSMPCRATIQTAGSICRLSNLLMMEEFNRMGPMMRLMLRYTQSLIAQVSQTTGCNRHHSVEQQLCRWLLLTLDRLPSNELTMTQELIASMLGVRREGITEAAGNLRRAGLISYRRGHITVLNRAGLELHACECYGVVKKEQQRLLNDYSELPAPITTRYLHTESTTHSRLVN
jgi:CRP-like cAMP-binding protein